MELNELINKFKRIVRWLNLFVLQEIFESLIYKSTPLSNYKKLAPLLVFLFASLIAIGSLYIYIFSILSFFGKSPFLNDDWVLTNIEGVIAVRDFILTLLLRGAPFLLTVTIAISTFLLNKYTQTSFKLLFKDTTLALLFFLGLTNVIFHLIVLMIIGDTRSINNNKEASIVFYNTLMILLTLILVIFIVSRIYANAFPKVISDKFVNNIKRLSRDIDKILTSEYKDDHSNLKKGISTQIRLFANVTINAIKSKDYNTIRHNIEKIDNEIYKSLISYLENNPRKLAFETIVKIGSESEKRLDDIISDIRIKSDEINQVIYESVLNLYDDIFESGLTNKEFYVCEIILEHNFEALDFKNENEKNLVVGLYERLFDLSLKYNKEGNTNSYYNYVLKEFSKLFDKDLEGFNSVLNKLCDSAIKNNQPKILFFTLKTLKIIY